MDRPGLGIKTALKLLRTHKTAERVVEFLRMTQDRAPEGGFDEYLAGVGLGVEEAFERRMLERACGAADDRGDELGFLEGEAAMAHACHAG
mgnify:CR=1 FL=1